MNATTSTSHAHGDVSGATPGAARSLLAAACLILLTIGVYLPTLSSEFVHLDDYQYVVDNPLVRSPSWHSVLRFFGEVRNPSTVDGYYQPLTMTSLMLDAAWGGSQGLSPFAYHLTNVLLHAATVVLLMLLARAAVGGVAVPLLVAVLFAVHPVQVESVAWISQRKTVLSTMLAVGSLLCYIRSTRTRQPCAAPPDDHRIAARRAPRRNDAHGAPKMIASTRSARRRSAGVWLGASLLLYLAACLAKPTVMLLPVILPLLDIWPLGRFLGRDSRRRSNGLVAAAGTPVGARAVILDKLPFLACMLPMFYVAWESQASSSAGLLGPNVSAAGWLGKTICLISYNLLLYLGNIFWPAVLSPYRDLPADLSVASPVVLLSVAATVGLAAAWISAWRWSRPLFVGGAAFLILLLPALGVVRFVETCVADRFLYLPVVFLTLPLAAVLAWTQGRWPRGAKPVPAAISLLAVPLLLWTWNQQDVWRDSRALWSRVVLIAPNLPKGHAQLAAQYLAADEFEPALRQARRALELAPEDAGYMHVLGRALVRTGHAAEAVVVLDRAIAAGLGPIEPLAHVSLAEALLVSGDADRARHEADRAIVLGRGETSTYAMLADAAYSYAKRFDIAAEYYREVLERDGNNLPARQFLARSLENCGRDAEALQQYEQVLAASAALNQPVPDYVRRAAEQVRQRLNKAASQPTR